MKESEEMRLKYAVCESTLSTAARSPFPDGEGLRYENTAIPKQSLSLEGKEKRKRLRRIFRKDIIRIRFFLCVRK